MRTTISLPDAVARDVDLVARQLGISRSELLAAAAREFVSRHTLEARTARLECTLAATEGEDDEPLIAWVTTAGRRLMRRDREQE